MKRWRMGVRWVKARDWGSMRGGGLVLGVEVVVFSDCAGVVDGVVDGLFGTVVVIFAVLEVSLVLLLLLSLLLLFVINSLSCFRRDA